MRVPRDLSKCSGLLNQIRELLTGINEDDLRTLRAIINGMLSKRKITPEQQAKMQAARKKNKPN